MVDHESSRTNEGEEQSNRILTIGRLLEAIASDKGMAQKARADICSGVRTLCHALGLPLESTPADPRIIADGLRGLTPAAARVSRSRLQNCRCYMDRAFEYADHRFGRRRNKRALTPEYASLLKTIHGTWDARHVRGVFHFASEQDVRPQDVDDIFFDRFLASLQNTTLPDPWTVDREARKGWNRLRTTVPGWPGQAVTVPSYVDHWALGPNRLSTEPMERS